MFIYYVPQREHLQLPLLRHWNKQQHQHIFLKLRTPSTKNDKT